MNYSVDLSLFKRSAHNPSLLSLKKSARDGGNENLQDYLFPVNPYFPTEEMLKGYHDNLEAALKDYPSSSHEMGDVLANTLNINPQNLVLANGATEIITWLDHLFVSESILTPIPTFGRWTDQPRETNKKLYTLQRKLENNFILSVEELVTAVRKTKAKALVFCNPNNPTGTILSKSDVVNLLQELADLELIIIDESFVEFADEDNIPTMADIIDNFENAIVVKSLGKDFGLHGLRFGYSVSNHKLATKLRLALPRWNINGIAEMVIRDLQNHLLEYEISRRKVISDRKFLETQLRTVEHIRVFPSAANFVLIKLPKYINGIEFRNFLVTEYGLIVRECSNKLGSDESYIRVTVRPKADSEILVKAIKQSCRYFSENISSSVS